MGSRYKRQVMLKFEVRSAMARMKKKKVPEPDNENVIKLLTVLGTGKASEVINEIYDSGEIQDDLIVLHNTTIETRYE